MGDLDRDGITATVSELHQWDTAFWKALETNERFQYPTSR